MLGDIEMHAVERARDDHLTRIEKAKPCRPATAA